MKQRSYILSRAMPIDQIAHPSGGGIYIVTAEPAGTVLYIGQTINFRNRRFDRHHKRHRWYRACPPGQEPAIRFATVNPTLSRWQMRDVEARLIRHASPACNDHHAAKPTLSTASPQETLQ